MPRRWVVWIAAGVLGASVSTHLETRARAGCADLNALATLGPKALVRADSHRTADGFSVTITWVDSVAGESCWVLVSESASPADDHPPREVQWFELPSDAQSFNDPTAYGKREEILYTLYAATSTERTEAATFIEGLPAVDPVEPLATPRQHPSQTPTPTTTGTSTPTATMTPEGTSPPSPTAVDEPDDDRAPLVLLAALGGAIVLAIGAVVAAKTRKHR